MAQAQGDYERAPRFYEESLSLLREAGDKRGISTGNAGLSDIARMRGDLPRARDLLEQVLQLSRERGEDRAVALTLESLGGIAETLTGPREATVLHRDSLAVFMRIGDQRGIAMALEGLARAAAQAGHFKRAAMWFGAASTLRRRIGAQPGRAEDAIASLRGRLGQMLFDKMWDVGCSLPLESVVAEAISPRATPRVAEARRQTKGPAASLTLREHEVVRLVALGRTNREVGEALVISPGTVRTHVEHILAKLGLRSRVEIAAWVIEHGVT